ncbi:MAG: hypothetical protein ABL308_08050 [Oceanicaulis sp.]
MAACFAALLCESAASAQIFGFGGEAGQVQPDAAPRYGQHVFGTGGEPDPYVIAIRSGGDYAARRSGFPDRCYGVVTEEPTIVLDHVGGAPSLSIFTAGRADTTLAIIDPSGAWRCDDDGAGRGTNAALTYRSPQPGLYRIWVGDFSDRESNSTLVISESSPFAHPIGRPNARAQTTPAVELSLAPGFTPDPLTIDVRTGYGVELGSLDVYGEEQWGRCSGSVGETPSAVVDWAGGGTLSFVADGEYDYVMDVRPPSGEAICNDDVGEFDERAGLTFENAEAGFYRIYVGLFFGGNSEVDATLTISNGPIVVDDRPFNPGWP